MLTILAFLVTRKLVHNELKVAEEGIAFILANYERSRSFDEVEVVVAA